MKSNTIERGKSHFVAGKISFRSLMAQAISGGFLEIVTDIYWKGALAYFYMQNLGLNAAYEAVAWIIFSIWNTVDDLLAGTIEDRSTNRLGRRLPYMRVFGPAAGLMFCLSFFKLPFIHTQLGLALCFLISICALDVFIAFIEVSLYSIPYEETLEKSERGKVLVVEAIFAALSLVVSVGLIPAIQPDPGQDLFRFRLIMCILGISTGLGIFVSSYFIDSSYRTDKDAVFSISKLKFVFDCIKNKAFLVAEIFETASIVSYTIFIFGIYYYFDEVCTDPLPCYIFAFAGILFGLAVYFLTVKRWELKTLVVFTALSSGILILIGFFIGGTVIGGAVACFGCGIACVGELIYFWLMLGDCIDADEVKNGVRREGTYNGFNCVFEAISNAVQPLFLAIILSYGYIEHQKLGTQSLAAQHGIMVAWPIPTATFLLIAGVLIWKLYPLDGKKVEENKHILEERRKAKEDAKHGE